jgi:hypothetical protein
MGTVFMLIHRYPDDGPEDTGKLIGIYATQADANAAIKRVLPQPGFRKFPNDFHISEFVIDQDHITEGFAYE